MNSNNGKIILIIGCMFSGKTSMLINRYNRYILGNKKCIMVKFKRDTRYDEFHIVTHDGIKINATRCEYLYEIDNIIQNYDVICIDEIQFYKDGYIMCDKWANQGKIVNACGLSGDFNRRPFPVVSNLISIADDIIFTKAICKTTGKNAIYSKLNNNISDAKSDECIGGSDMYSAVDRKTYFGDNKEYYMKDLYRSFIKFYVENKCNKNGVLYEDLVNKYDNNKNYKDIIEQL